MRFIPAALDGACVIELDRIEDERGFFARTFCRDEFATHGLRAQFVQCSVSFNATRRTLRGMHYQASPHEEAKLVRCTQGVIFDAIVDLRRASPTFKRWFGVELSADNRRALYIPEGCAHGFQTLEDASEVFYQISEVYCPEAARGVRWNDPAFGIAWPLKDPIVSARDAGYPDFIS